MTQEVEEKASEDIKKAISAEMNTTPYISMSKLPATGAATPLSLVGETMMAQYNFTESVPDVDEYVVRKLQYSSKYALSQALGAEQIDAVGLAINQIESGMGFILADGAGIGKGRICASILRYAKVNDCLPIFITEKANLFSAIYRDLIGIGGLIPSNSGIIAGYPLILNGYESGGFEVIKDNDGNEISKTKRPSATGILDENGEEVITAPKEDKIKAIMQSGELPKNYDYILLTYSQISGKEDSGGAKKTDFLLKLIQSLNGKAILVIDECHNATGTKSSVGKSVSAMISISKGVLFSSATFSKSPDNMNLYAQKTNIITSPLPQKNFIDVIKAGGERLIENLASNLVECQQMIRRQMTAENCEVDYEFMKDSEMQDLFKKYDLAVKTYNDILVFFKSQEFRDAKKTAIRNYAIKHKIDYCEIPKPSEKKELEDWYRENAGRYSATFTSGEAHRNQFNFIETLLFGLKADFVSKQILHQLTTLSKNVLTIDKSEFMSNRKVVLSVRNTLEGAYAEGLNVGDVIKKADFIVYVYNIAKNSATGLMTFTKIVKPEKEEKKKGGKKKKRDTSIDINAEVTVIDSDYSDGGKAYAKLLSDISEINLNIPLSPIDAVIQKIESTRRESWDEYGDGNPYFSVGEVTGRKFCLLKQEDGTYKLEINNKPKNKSRTFKDFNNGKYDVLLINEAGSTGEDAHSKSTFKDQRPRAMVIHQVELDPNTEVQKRGRINRTGMVNYPRYIYAISRIPSEVRRLLMLTRKLRRLDANTTANQKQSAKLSAFVDKEGKQVEDTINQYGDECLSEFLKIDDNKIYLKYQATEAQKKISGISDGAFEIEHFLRNLELASSEEQAYFYNTLNAMYLSMKEEKGGFLDLETKLIDLKGQIRTRLLLSKGSDVNPNPFNASVYIEDNYVFAEDKPYTIEKVQDLVLELSKGKDPDEFCNDFSADYKKHFYEVRLVELKNAVKIPDYASAKDWQEEDAMKAAYESKLKDVQISAEQEFEPIRDLIDAVHDKNNSKIFRPNKYVAIPSILEECFEVDDKGEYILPTTLPNYGRFIGFKIHTTAKEKYSPMNIEFVFCQLSGKPRVSFKPTAKGIRILDCIDQMSAGEYNKIRTKRIRGGMGEIPNLLVRNWLVDKNKRDIIRLLTGNVLGAYSIAKDIINEKSSSYRPNNFSPIIRFLKFTTAAENSIRFGLQLLPKEPLKLLEAKNNKAYYPLNSKTMITDMLTVKSPIRIINAEQDFRLAFDMFNAKIIIFGGGEKAKEWKKSTKYYSELYDNAGFKQLLSSLGIPFTTKLFRFVPKGNIQNTIARAIEFTIYRVAVNVDALHKILSYIYSIDPMNITLEGITDEQSFDEEDDYDFKKGKHDIFEQEGEYRYDAYSEQLPAIQGFSKYAKHEVIYRKVRVFLNRRATVKECILFGLIPLDNQVSDMVYDTYSTLYSDSVKIKLKKDISDAVAKNIGTFEIGEIVEDSLKGRLRNLGNIFGYSADDKEFIGEVFTRHEKGEIEMPENKKEESDGEEEKPKRGLDMSTAEEFMILFHDKIKKYS
jgi:hypothetical protein